MKKIFKIATFTALVSLGLSPLFASKQEQSVTRATDSGLPPVGLVLQNALKRANYEDQNERGFKAHYAYSRRKVNEERNGQGKVKKREQKLNQYFPATTSPAPQPVSATITPLSKTPKKALTKEDF